MAFQAMNHGLEARATSRSRHNEPAPPAILVWTEYEEGYSQWRA